MMRLYAGSRYVLSLAVMGAVLGAEGAGFVFGAGPVGPNITHGPVQVELLGVASGLVAPVDMLPVPGNPLQQVIVDQAGKVRLLDNGVLQAAPYFDVTSRLVPLMSGFDERGLLGFAFDPNFNGPVGTPGHHTVYTYNTEPVNGAATFTVPLNPGTSMNSQNVLASWNVDTLVRKELLRIDKPQFNHNGGVIAFGADGLLYMGTGDGGGANDSGNGHNAATGNSQDLTTALGKILRIDVRGNNSANGQYGIPVSNPFSGAGQVKEVYAYGLRNPFRFSFDAPTGKLIVADVGQNNIEEINIVENGGNYGWRLREGTFDFNPAGGTISAAPTPPPPGITDPVAQYDHVNGGLAVIGGFVYHGTGIPELTGKYVFGEFSTSFGSPLGRLFYMDLEGPQANQIHEFIIGTTDRPLGLYLKGFGVDASGELYVLATGNLGPSGTSGQVFRLVPVPEGGTLVVGVLGAAMLILRRRGSRS